MSHLWEMWVACNMQVVLGLLLYQVLLSFSYDKPYKACSNKSYVFIIKWGGGGMWHVMETGEVHTGFWLGDLRERGHLEDLGVEERILLKLIFKKWDGRHGLDWSDLGRGQMASTCECSNETSGSIKGREFQWLTEDLLASEEGLCSIECVSEWMNEWVS